MTRECPREAEVLEAVVLGTWPGECDEALRAHATSCAICREVAQVATVLREDHQDTARLAHLPGSGIVWWRAQMRARAEAARAASTPITFIQGIAAACIVGAAVALAGFAFPMMRSWLVSIFQVSQTVQPAAGDTSAIASLWRWLPLVAVMSIVLAPVAIYLAVTDD